LIPPVECVLRPTTAADVPILFSLIQALADYEKLSHEVVGQASALAEHLFGDRPYVEAMVAEVDGKAVGFALWFPTYISCLAQPGLYLEDLFVLPEYRGQGIGKALLTGLYQLAVDRGCDRLEWSVLDWNAPAINFYRRMGASLREENRICRLTGQQLTQVAAANPTSNFRLAGMADLPGLWSCIQAKAEKDGLSQTLTGTLELLSQHVCQVPPAIKAVLVEQNGEVMGFATFFHNYSTFLTQPGLRIEALFGGVADRERVLEAALLTEVARLAVARNCGRVEWEVAAEDEQAIAVYQKLGATVLPDWRLCQVRGAALS
ncbi:MAG: GNAT family N-acetyltransferase, partial [Leptolyngbyaceae bacterium]|nr:GNAT family N-acetyltransferase [Leptolyngbyaceae bacterium]